MSKKHLIIKDADEDIEYDVEEVTEAEEPAEETVEEKVEETEKEVCPECGKEPCECKPASEEIAFTKEEVDALKELISIVPDLKKLLEEKLAEKQEEEKAAEEKQEQPEIQEIEEVEEKEESSEEEEDEELDEIDSITDSVGSLEHTVSDGIAEDDNTIEAAMAEKFKKYYGGN